MSGLLQAPAKRNVIVHAASGARGRRSHVNREKCGRIVEGEADPLGYRSPEAGTTMSMQDHESIGFVTLDANRDTVIPVMVEDRLGEHMVCCCRTSKRR